MAAPANSSSLTNSSGSGDDDHSGHDHHDHDHDHDHHDGDADAGNSTRRVLAAHDGHDHDDKNGTDSDTGIDAKEGDSTAAPANSSSLSPDASSTSPSSSSIKVGCLRSQVVAGTNYQFAVCANSQVYQVTVFVPLPFKNEQPEISYFEPVKGMTPECQAAVCSALQ